MRYYNVFIVIFNDFLLFSPRVTDSLCRASMRWQGFTLVFTLIITELILQIRIYAMYGRSKKILTLLVACFIPSITATIVIVGILFSSETVTATPFPGSSLHFCAITSAASIFYAILIPILIFETLLFSLALFKGYQSWKSECPTGWSGQRALNILIRDSILYFFVVFATYMTNMFIWAFGQAKLADVPIGFMVAMSTVMTQRLLLNIRQTYITTTLNGPSSTSGSTTVAELRLELHAYPIGSSGDLPAPSSTYLNQCQGRRDDYR